MVKRSVERRRNYFIKEWFRILSFIKEELEDNQISAGLKNELSLMANSYVYNYTPSFNSLRMHTILQKLKCNKNTVIIHPDKGSGVVILNRHQYLKSMSELMSHQ